MLIWFCLESNWSVIAYLGCLRTIIILESIKVLRNQIMLMCFVWMLFCADKKNLAVISHTV